MAPIITARADRHGRIITETDDGAWTRRSGTLVEDDAGDMHPATGDGALEVAELLSRQTSEQITVDDVRRAWASVRT